MGVGFWMPSGRHIGLRIDTYAGNGSSKDCKKGERTGQVHIQDMVMIRRWNEFL